ncbi:hypothetical protein M0804_007453 [Polistes exclamans]|nr:hypothetical protein M0804_007453 [Polistes exclamans]
MPLKPLGQTLSNFTVVVVVVVVGLVVLLSPGAACTSTENREKEIQSPFILLENLKLQTLGWVFDTSDIKDIVVCLNHKAPLDRRKRLNIQVLRKMDWDRRMAGWLFYRQTP